MAFAAAPGWAGEPVNREPARHAELVCIDPGAPPEDLVAYTRAGRRTWQSGAAFAVHWQRPGSGRGARCMMSPDGRTS